MPTDRDVQHLIINKLTKAQYEAIETPDPDQLYFIIDDNDYAKLTDLPQPSNAAPAMDGTATAGIAVTYSRSDHVHPTDTSKQDKITASGILKGDGAGGATAAVAGTDYVKDYVTAGQKSGTTLGTKATAEGEENTASGAHSHAEGFYTTASSSAAHAEGSITTASGLNSHAEGDSATASGHASHAEGVGATAAGYGSHAEGRFTIANGAYQHVFGTYNIEDEPVVFYPEENAKGTYIEIVGNGSFNDSSQTADRSNARTLDWSGNEVLAGKLTVGTGPTNNMDVATKQYVDSKEVPPEVFYINITGSGTQAAPYTADHTYAEITTALSAGKLPIVIHNGGYYIYGGNSGDYDFYQAGATYIRSFFVTSANVWSDQIDSIVTSVNGLTGDIETNDVLPDQTGNDGMFLMTDGSDASWADVEPEVFVAEYGTTTYDEVQTAYDAGKIVVVFYNDYAYQLAYCNDSVGAIFETITTRSSGATYRYASVQPNNNWATGTIALAPFASPAFTGTPTAPTPTSSSAATQIATKGYVDSKSITYTLSISGNRITLTPSSGTTSYIDLPVYNGTVV